MGVHAEINAPMCLANGDCADILPDVFEVADVAKVIGTADQARLLNAARQCPMQAIRVVDGAGTVLYP